MTPDAATRTVPDIDDLKARLTAYTLPSGVVTIQPHEAWLGEDAMLAEHSDDGQLGPMWVFLVGLRGMGLGIGDLVGLAGSAATDGVLFGELGFTESAPVEIGREYTVTGEITGITRKTGARSGTFDILSFMLQVSEQDTVHGSVSCSFILPRRAA